jgi:hypothetical protein
VKESELLQKDVSLPLTILLMIVHRLVCINIEKHAQVAPMDSSFCSKLRVALGRELIWDIGKNARKSCL